MYDVVIVFSVSFCCLFCVIVVCLGSVYLVCIRVVMFLGVFSSGPPPQKRDGTSQGLVLKE